VIAARLREVRHRVEEACRQAGRDPDEVVLIAVTKTVSPESIAEAYAAGHRHFGESRLQEALPKIEALPRDIVWHFIGKLQSNKLRKAAEVFDVLHTVETESQIEELKKIKRQVDVLIEINIAEEPQKAGIFANRLDEFKSKLLNCEQARLQGLMTVGPALHDSEAIRPFFRKMRELRDWVLPQGWLSMGMSGDFDVAIQEGATHIRVGSAVFGERR
jgi:PLP dependent protein